MEIENAVILFTQKKDAGWKENTIRPFWRNICLLVFPDEIFRSGVCRVRRRRRKYRPGRIYRIVGKKEILAYDVNLVALLFTSIKNRCIDLLRHRIVVKEAVNLIQEEYQATLRMKLASLELFDQSLLSEQDIERIITEVVDSLPEKCREIFIKSKIEGKKQKDIAAELNISLKTVENQMDIAYKKIKSELKDYLPLLIFLLAN